MSALLTIASLTRQYQGLTAVDRVDLVVASGGVHAVIGPNGAGKTTLFNLISGIVAPTSGRIVFQGEEIGSLSADRRAALGIGRTFQNIRVFGAMTVLENTLTGLHARLGATLPEILARLGRFRREERHAAARAMAALDFVGLAARANERGASLAYGDQRRLEIARALAPEPKLLLLDEPVAGMNQTETAALARLVSRLPDAGSTVLLVEHDMGFVMGLSQTVTVLNFGRRIFEGPPAAVRADRGVIEAYLGARVAARLAAAGPMTSAPG